MRTHFGAIWEAVADAVPEQTAIVQRERRLSWREYEQRAARLARALLDAGLGPEAKVGMYLYNSPEYCETNFAAIKIRGVPINVNYRYLDDELDYLLDNADAEALVFHSSLGDRIARVRAGSRSSGCSSRSMTGPRPTVRDHVEGSLGLRRASADVLRPRTASSPRATRSTCSTRAAPPGCPRA